jgi:hypothetical protein
MPKTISYCITIHLAKVKTSLLTKSGFMFEMQKTILDYMMIRLAKSENFFC